MPKVSREVARQREVDAWRMRCEGDDQDTIAAALGVTQPAVSQILARVGKRKGAQLDVEVEQRRTLHRARLEWIFAEAMKAWAESKKPKQKSRHQKTVFPAAAADLAAMLDGQPLIGGLPTAAAIREVSIKEAMKSDGHSPYLKVALEADAELRKMDGIDAPKKIDLLDQRRPLEKLTDEELAKRAAEAEALLKADGDVA